MESDPVWWPALSYSLVSVCLAWVLVMGVEEMDRQMENKEIDPDVQADESFQVEDAKKLHAEINQIENQRFNLTTAALTIFGVVTAWLIPRDPTLLRGEVGRFACLGSIFLQTLLLVIFVVNHKFRLVTRTIACYLVLKHASQWEMDWNRFRGKGDYGYSEWQVTLFIVLTALSAFWPLALGLLYDLKLEPLPGIWVSGVIGATYILIMVSHGLIGWDKRNLHIEERWRKALKLST